MTGDLQGGQKLITLRGGHQILIAAGKGQKSQGGQKLRFPVKLFQGTKASQRRQGEPLIGSCQTEQAKVPRLGDAATTTMSLPEGQGASGGRTWWPFCHETEGRELAPSPITRTECRRNGLDK